MLVFPYRHAKACHQNATLQLHTRCSAPTVQHKMAALLNLQEAALRYTIQHHGVRNVIVIRTKH